MRLSDPKHPYQQHKRQHRATLRKPSASQDAVRYWWTKPGTKEAQEMVDLMKDQYIDFKDHLEEMIDLYKEQLSTASANGSPESAKGWGKYSRMLELHNGL